MRLPKEETAISAPMWALTSLFLAAGVEARDSVEAVAVVIAIAGMLISSARSM